MARMNKCASCGGALAASKKRQKHQIGAREFVVTVSGSTCKSCGALFLENESLERADQEVACELARHGPPSGDAFRFLRKTLGMRAIDLADLMDVTPETISRWETGQRNLDESAWITVGSLVLEKASRAPETLLRLRELRARGPSARSIRIDATRGAGLASTGPKARRVGSKR